MGILSSRILGKRNLLALRILESTRGDSLMSQASRSGNTPSALSSALRFFRRKRAGPDNVDTGDGRFSIPSEVCSSTHAEGLVLFHTGRDLVFQANQTGSLI